MQKRGRYERERIMMYTYTYILVVVVRGKIGNLGKETTSRKTKTKNADRMKVEQCE